MCCPGCNTGLFILPRLSLFNPYSNPITPIYHLLGYNAGLFIVPVSRAGLVLMDSWIAKTRLRGLLVPYEQAVIPALPNMRAIPHGLKSWHIGRRTCGAKLPFLVPHYIAHVVSYVSVRTARASARRSLSVPPSVDTPPTVAPPWPFLSQPVPAPSSSIPAPPFHSPRPRASVKPATR